jgi:hypothetical protein
MLLRAANQDRSQIDVKATRRGRCGATICALDRDKDQVSSVLRTAAIDDIEDGAVIVRHAAG